MGSADAIILAAGASLRLGAKKQLLHYNGQTLLNRTIAACRHSSLDRVIVVLGAFFEELQESIHDTTAIVLQNHDWESGIGSSISCGVKHLSALPQQPDATILLLCDQPLVNSTLINGLLTEFRRNDASIVASQYGGTFGVPALFTRRYFAELEELREAGAKSIIAAAVKRQAARFVQFPGGEVDIDTIEDYKSLLATKMPAK